MPLPKIQIRPPESEEDFQKYFRLRWEILRRPWGQPEGSEQDEREKDTVHVMAVDESGEVVGAARLQFNSESEAQIRYMAVAEQAQGKGIGAALLFYLEKEAKSNEIKIVILDAREPAVPFYLKQGYQICGDSYLLFGEIRHKKMYKNLI